MAQANPEVRPRNLVGTAIQVVVLLLLTAILAGVVIVLLGVLSVIRAPSEAASGAAQALSAAQQAIQNVTDPNHPPVGLSYDTEFTGFATWHVGDGLPGGTDYVLTIKAIQRRDGASSPQTAEYAIIHAELRQARVTRILGQIIRSDSDPHDYVIYTGEVFRIGKQIYRVNWVSQDESAIAAGIVRTPDTITQPLKFDYQ